MYDIDILGRPGNFMDFYYIETVSSLKSRH